VEVVSLVRAWHVGAARAGLPRAAGGIAPAGALKASQRHQERTGDRDLWLPISRANSSGEGPGISQDDGSDP
jgi:hypothetical protein